MADTPPVRYNLSMDRSHTMRGKWSQSGVPHRGWSCVGIEDLGEPVELCEMCESMDIRYVHSMQHPDYKGILGVGCICAEHMEGDYTTPRLREKRLKSAARRRISWPKRIWSLSHLGNLYLNIEGYNLAVYRQGGSDTAWRIAVTHRDSGRRQEGKRIYASAEQAQAASLDALLWAKDRLGG